jgi:AraC family transcriptional regulator
MPSPSTNPATWGRTRTRSIGGFAITEFTQPPDRRLPWHVHDNASICFVLAGSYTERIGTTEHECPPSSVVFKPASERHADHFGATGGTCLLMEITPARMAAIEQSSSWTARPLLARTPHLAAAGQRIYGEFAAGDALSPLVVEGLMLEILGEAARAHRPGAVAAQPAWLRRVLERLHDCPADSLTLSSLAQEVGVHPAHLARTFRQHCRCSIGEYLRRLRIEHACQELQRTGTPIAEIALRAGFFDQSHFSRVFRQQTGMSPARFRSASHEATRIPKRN